MADGSSKPISAVRVGDRISNSVPGDTTVQAHTVDRVIVTSTDHDFVDVTVKTSVTSRVKAAAAKAVAGAAVAVVALTAGAGVASAAPADTPASAAAAEVPASTVTTTFHHPFYDITQASFIDAVNLHTGDELQTTDGETATITSVRAYHATEVTYDLTIDGLHTYYVEAGTTPVLVHNCGGNSSINDKRLAHVEYRHDPGGRGQAIQQGETDLPGEFNEDFIWNENDDHVLGDHSVHGANNSPELRNPNGPGHIHQYDYGRTIGVNGAGVETSLAEIIVRSGKIWTAYPK